MGAPVNNSPLPIVYPSKEEKEVTNIEHFLPCELLLYIIDYVAGFGSKKNLKDVRAMELVSRKWNHLVNATVSVQYWKRLEQAACSHLRLKMNRIYNGLDTSKILKPSYLECFQTLDSEFGIKSFVVKPRFYIREMQAILDVSLEAIWTRILEIHPRMGPDSLRANEIRNWLNNPMNKEAVLSVVELDLSCLQLQELPSEIGIFTELTELILSDNQLRDLPSEIAAFTKLDVLDLSTNEFRDFPPAIFSFIELTELKLSDNQLREIPSEITVFTKLEVLDLDTNELRDFPSPIVAFSELIELNLSDNQLREIPSEITVFTKLRKLNLSDNQLREILFDIIYLTQLVKIDFSSNEIVNIDSHLFSKEYFPCLEKIYLGNNKIENIPDTIGTLPRLVRLHLNNNRLKDLSPGLFTDRFLRLEELCLSDNQLTRIPDSMRTLSELRCLFLDNNRLTSIPSSVCQLRKLLILEMKNNRFRSIPNEIWDNQMIESANFNNNQIMGILPIIINEGLESIRCELNPLICLLNKDLTESNVVYSQEVMKARYWNCSIYSCKTPFAALFQQIHQAADSLVLREGFEELAGTLQQQITNKILGEISSSSVEVTGLEQDIFANIDLFLRTVFTTAREMFNSLSQDQKEIVYEVALYLIDKQGETVPHAISVIDAMELLSETPPESGPPLKRRRIES